MLGIELEYLKLVVHIIDVAPSGAEWTAKW